MAILVTGGLGFIGSNFINKWFEFDGGELINLDKLTYAASLDNVKNISKNLNYKFVKGSITNKRLLNKIFSDYKIDVVINFAAESHVDRSIYSPKEFINTNINGTYELLEVSRKKANLEKFIFIHVSTDEVYGSLKSEDPSFTEKNRYLPNSPYSASKASSDHLARAYFHTFGLPTIITNCSNNFGPFQFPEKLIPLIIFNALNEKILPIYGDGKQIRDWVFVEDHCEAIIKLIKQGIAGETYNIGGNNEIKNIEMVNKICMLLDDYKPRSNSKKYSDLINFVKDRPGHDKRYAMNITKIKKEIGWEPRYNFDFALDKTIQWYLKNQKWITKIKSKEHKVLVKKNYET